MAHTDTTWMTVANAAGQGLMAVAAGKPFSFNCAHFTPAQLTATAHDYELVPMEETCINRICGRAASVPIPAVPS